MASPEETVMAYEDQLDADLLKFANNSKALLSFSANPSPPFRLNAFGMQATQGSNPLQLVEDEFTITRDVTGEISGIASVGRGTIYTKNYDSAGRLTGVSAGALKTAIAYDGFGRKAKISHSDGTTGIIGYDPLNRVVNMRWQEKGVDTVFQSLAYDLAGNITKMAREHGTYALSYDESDQLIASNYQGKLPDQSGAWEYDLLGNRLRDSKNGVSRQTSNFLLQNEKSSFFADLDGFGETAGEKTKEESKSFSYRADGKIAGYIGNGVVAKYHYDGLDRLIAKEIQTKSGSFTQSFVHLEGETGVLLGKAGDGSITTYIDGQGVAERLGEVKGTSSKGYITDHLGSVLNGDVAGSSKSYGLFGEVDTPPTIGPSSNPVVYGFQGYSYDVASGQYETESGRRLMPQIGRWNSQEPNGDDGPNLYLAFGNNPLGNIDPDGYKTLPVHMSREEYETEIANEEYDRSHEVPLENIYPENLIGFSGALKAGACKVVGSKITKTIGGKFIKTIKTVPGKGPGMSRAEYVVIKNNEGKVLRTYKDTFDRSNKFQHRKPLRGGPEGRE